MTVKEAYAIYKKERPNNEVHAVATLQEGFLFASNDCDLEDRHEYVDSKTGEIKTIWMVDYVDEIIDGLSEMLPIESIEGGL